MRPGPLGTLVDERADVVDVTATVVDLAVRGHLRIEELGAHMVVWRDWRLVRLEDAPDDLAPFERALLDKLFGVGVMGRRQVVRLSELQDTFADSMDSLRRSLEAEVVRRGWFRDRPGQVRLQWYLTAAAALVAALGVAVLLVAFTRLGLVGVALVLPPAALLLAGHSMAARTPVGAPPSSRRRPCATTWRRPCRSTRTRTRKASPRCSRTPWSSGSRTAGRARSRRWPHRPTALPDRSPLSSGTSGRRRPAHRSPGGATSARRSRPSPGPQDQP